MTSAPVTRRRRRGRLLQDAIFDAVIAELAEGGYGRLTMEGIALRAKTAKSTLYRRWSSLEELVTDTLDHRLPDPEAFPDTGDLREDLIIGLGRMADRLASPIGQAIAGLIGALQASPTLRELARERIIGPRVRASTEVLRRGVERGEARPGALTPFVVQTGPALMVFTHLVQGLRLSRKDIEDIVDQIILPAVRPSP